MQFATLLDQKERVKAESGIEAYCPGCLEQVIAKCGDIRIHHFSHKQGSNCHLYKPESEWHLEWKEKFPEHSREFIMKNESDQTHIADVAFENCIWEFQSKLLDSDIVCDREVFWTKLNYEFCWMIKSPKKLCFQKKSEGVYHANFFSRKFDYLKRPFFIDMVGSEFLFKVYSIYRITGSQADIKGRFIHKNQFNLLHE